MDKNTRILVTGATGMLGKNTVEALQEKGYKNLILPSSTAVDLRDAGATDALFAAEKPDVVLHLAARVGGIQANIDAPVDFLRDNVLMGMHVIHAAHTHGVQKLINMGSSCIYPRECPQPMREEYMLTGSLEPTNEGYALAKITALKLCASLHAQYGANFYTLIPPNLYGAHERLDSEHSHVIASLMLKFVAAQKNGDAEMTLWGTGSARREFLNVQDAAKGLLFFMEQIDASSLEQNYINMGSGTDVSIRELAEMICAMTAFKGAIKWDADRPDGMPRKLLDSTRSLALGWKPSITLEQGLEEFHTYVRMRQ